MAAAKSKQPPVSSARLWLAGARLRTLPLAFAPVIAGAGLAHTARAFSWLLTLLALLVSVLLQIGVNYANDYSDGIRGTDDYRVGPVRLTGSGAVPAKLVLRAALVCFGIAALAGLAAIVISGRWLFLALGVAAILAAWFYTGGKKPYGYMGLGELVVFVFFGPVATLGTYFLQADISLQEVYWAAAGIGCLSVAVLIANNTRDIETDRQAGKITLSARIGERGSRALFVTMVFLPFAVPLAYIWFYPELMLVLMLIFAAAPISLIMCTARTPGELIRVLQLTSLLTLGYAILLVIGFNG
ncbi:1,4-dihydroxy-2-naphthoate polyprenyltransferase [Canibacter sp. lx-45]|uniref:1,4-dihydroxy-2-naphthoate polyprenyltransferase n=1 Tax=Canibacter zhuwentaonis TaxID=2837491 RepID=UPI001BDD6BB1|nr:1,4-dihydroxy-2-naphthoate polyprenyltransferase [Canibacter zhuwentaonis]